MSRTGGQAAPLCPSAPASPGARLLGVVAPDGHLARFGTPLPVDGAFIDAANEAGGTGHRFRFAASCAEAHCTQWTGQQCGLIGQIRDRAERLGWAVEPNLPRCAIRAQCRWWQQDAAAACAVCSRVVYHAAAPANV